MKLTTRLTILIHRGGMLLIGLGGRLAGRAGQHHDAGAQAATQTAQLPPELADIDPQTLAAWRREGAPMHWLALVARESPAYLRAGPPGVRSGSGSDSGSGRRGAPPQRARRDGPAKAPGIAAPDVRRREAGIANDAPDIRRARSSVLSGEAREGTPNRRVPSASLPEPPSLPFSRTLAARAAHMEALTVASQAQDPIRSHELAVNPDAADSAVTAVRAAATEPAFDESPHTQTAQAQPPQARPPQALRRARPGEIAPRDAGAGAFARPPAPPEARVHTHMQVPDPESWRPLFDEPLFSPANIAHECSVECDDADDPAIAPVSEALFEPFAPARGPVLAHRAQEPPTLERPQIRPLPERAARDSWPALPGRGVRETDHWRHTQREATAMRELEAEQREVTWNALRF